jgi:hypothetical protein
MIIQGLVIVEEGEEEGMREEVVLIKVSRIEAVTDGRIREDKEKMRAKDKEEGMETNNEVLVKDGNRITREMTTVDRASTIGRVTMIDSKKETAHIATINLRIARNQKSKTRRMKRRTRTFIWEKYKAKRTITTKISTIDLSSFYYLLL